MKSYLLAIGLCLVLAIAACADVRLVDGMWVTDAVSDEDARRYAKQYRTQPTIPRSELLRAKRQKIWAQSLGSYWVPAPQVPAQFTVKGWSYQGLSKYNAQQGSAMLSLPAGLMPGDYDRLFYRQRLDKLYREQGDWGIGGPVMVPR